MNVLERDIALMTQRFEDLRGRMNDLMITAATITRIEVTAAQLGIEVVNIRRDIADRDKESSADRRSSKAALLGIGAAIIATVVAGVITMLIALSGVR